MKLYPPMMITPRLLPGIEVGEATISIESAEEVDDRGAPKWCYYIDTRDFEHHGNDLSGHEGPEGMMESLLAFLSAAGEAYRYEMRTGREGENSDLFPPEVVEWAADNYDEISILQCELEESLQPEREKEINRMISQREER